MKEVCLAANHFLDVLSAHVVCDAVAAVSVTSVSSDRCAAGTDACWASTHVLISAGLMATAAAGKLAVATAEAGTLIAVALT